MICKFFTILKPPSLRILLPFTTIAFSKEPPLANPFFFIFSIFNKKVLEQATLKESLPKSLCYFDFQ